MPYIIPAIVEAVAIIYEAIGAYGIVMALTTLASISFSVYSMMNMPKTPGYDADVTGRTHIIRSAVAPHRVVYGQCLISGPLVASFSCGSFNQYIYLVIALTSHEVEEIGDIYLNDTLSTDIKYRAANAVTQEVLTEYYTVPAGRIIKLASGYAEPPSIRDQYNVVIDQSLYTLKGRLITFHDDSYLDTVVAVDIKKSYVTVNKYLGTQDQTADPDLLLEALDLKGNNIWTTNHKLTGRAYIVVRLEYNTAVFASGLPNIKAVVKGVKDIYDPRTEMTGWTDNAALCVRDYLLKPYGLNLRNASSDIDDTNFIAAANICDEQVPITVGTGTGYMTDAAYYATGRTGVNLISGTGSILAGDTITITISDGTYTIAGTSTHFPASTNSYTVETALASGLLVLAGTGLSAAIPPVNCAVTVHTSNEEKRYTCNGSFTLNAKPVDIMKQILTSCAGRPTWSQGTYKLLPAAYNYPIGSLTSDDLRDDISVIPAPSRQQRFNTVRGTFVCPEQYWQQVDFPLQQNAAQYTADENFEICQTLELPYTISASMAQRLAAIYLNQNLRGITVNMPCKLTAFPYQPGDVINLTIDQLSWVEKGFRITDWKLSETGGIDLTLREEDSSIYGWTLTDEKPYSPPARVNVAAYVLPAT